MSTIDERQSGKRNEKAGSSVRDVKIWPVEGIGEAIRRAGIPDQNPKARLPNLTIGVLETGALKAYYRRATHTLPSGRLILCQAGEILATGPIDRARRTVGVVLECTSCALQNVADEVAGRRTAMPFFPDFIKPDPHLVALFLRFQRMLEVPASRLERSSCFHDMLTKIILRRASPPPTWRNIKPERALVRRVREYLDDNYAENINLDHLSRMVNLSAFHLNRVFRTEVGIPPHAYQTQIRVMRGKSLLAQGMAIDQVAVEVGFFDQSHFTNHFKRLLSYTPGIYQKNILRK